MKQRRRTKGRPGHEADGLTASCAEIAARAAISAHGRVSRTSSTSGSPPAGRPANETCTWS